MLTYTDERHIGTAEPDDDTLLFQQDARITDRVLGQRGMHLEELATPPAPRPFTSEMRLAAEVLRQAFADLEENRAEIRDDATAWFEREDCDRVLSFVGVCELLAFDPENIRRAAQDPDRRRAINERLRWEWDRGGRTA